MKKSNRKQKGKRRGKWKIFGFLIEESLQGALPEYASQSALITNKSKLAILRMLYERINCLWIKKIKNKKNRINFF